MSAHVHHPLQGWLRGAHEGMFGLTRHAAWYDRVAGRLAQPLYRRVAADAAAAGLPEGALVVDAGTGPGRVPLMLAEQCPGLVVEGIDLSGEMIARARQSAVAAGVPESRLRYRTADVAALPYPDASVDLVVSSLSLHHWGDVPAGLREIRRVLRPSGQAWIYDVRPVLERVARQLTAHGLDVTLEPLSGGRPSSVRPVRPAGIGLALAGRFVARLTLIRPAD